MAGIGRFRGADKLIAWINACNPREFGDFETPHEARAKRGQSFGVYASVHSSHAWRWLDPPSAGERLSMCVSTRRTQVSSERLQRFFDAVEVNDVVDERAILPDRGISACTQAQIRACYSLCLQFWKAGVPGTVLLRIVRQYRRTDGPSADQRLQFKHARARYKQLRFAQSLYGVRHKPPLLLHMTIVCMGQLQDAFRHGSRGATIGYSLVLDLLLTRPCWALARHAADQTRLDSADGFAGYCRAEMRRLEEALRRDRFSGRQFHAMRKIVSRQVSFFDALRSLEPGEYAYRMSRFLSALNGLMGARHDEMVEQAMSRQRGYRTPVPLAADVRQRLTALVIHYRAWHGGPR